MRHYNQYAAVGWGEQGTRARKKPRQARGRGHSDEKLRRNQPMDARSSIARVRRRSAFNEHPTDFPCDGRLHARTRKRLVSLHSARQASIPAAGIASRRTQRECQDMTQALRRPLLALRGRRTWGAIALDTEDNAKGDTTGASSKSAASDEALSDCSRGGARHCRIIFTYSNQCASVAWGDHAFGVSAGTTIDDAQRNAVTECAKGSPGCKPVYQACSPAEKDFQLGRLTYLRSAPASGTENSEKKRQAQTQQASKRM